jgi:mannan endo-1,4-beta-mannosidase
MKLLIFLLIYFLPLNAMAVLVDTNATTETKALYTQLQNVQGNYIYFGQADPLRFTSVSPNSDSGVITGKQPYVYEFCLQLLSSTDLTGFFETYNASSILKKHYRNGGICAITWWAINSVNITTYLDKTGDPVTNVLPGGTARAVYLAQLDEIATFLNNLKDDNGALIPVIWRSFHENDGDWFWWGIDTCTETQYIALWQDMVTYLRDTKGIHNILYCYNPEVINGYTYDGALYPGDDYVDICGVDRYSDTGITASVLASYQAANDIALAKGKVYAITEGFRNLEDYPLATAWTDWIDAILADSKTKNAAYVTCHRGGVIGQKWGPLSGRSDEASFLEMSKNPKIKMLGYYQFKLNGVKMSGVHFK